MMGTPNWWGRSVRDMFPRCLACLLEKGCRAPPFFLLLPVPLTCEGPVSRA